MSLKVAKNPLEIKDILLYNDLHSLACIAEQCLRKIDADKASHTYNFCKQPCHIPGLVREYLLGRAQVARALRRGKALLSFLNCSQQHQIPPQVLFSKMLLWDHP
jgi:hypothetical protein